MPPGKRTGTPKWQVMPARLTRRVRFSSAHHYSRPNWSEAANAAAFGSSRFVHGHNFVLSVTVQGPLDPDTGFVVDLGTLDALLQEVVAPLRQRDLSVVIPEFAAGKEIPTTESLARWFWRRLQTRIPGGAQLALVRVAEDEDLWSEYWES